jgi:hypothetical protein
MRTILQFANPVYSYRHSGSTPSGCAITGGAFYYIDPGNPPSATQFATGISLPTDLKIGPDGSLYYLARGAGSIGKIARTAPPSAPLNLRIVQ